jgi:hypothetical protein
MINNRPAMAWSLSARPRKADEGAVFLDLSTDTMYAYESGKWHELDDMKKSKARKAEKAKAEEAETTEVISETEKPAETAEPTPKKKTTKKKTASKKEAE